MSKPYTLHLGNCHDVLDTLPENSVDSIVTDPPYEINFMAKSWDNAGVAFNPVTWEKAMRVLKPGGHMLVFGHSRKMHRIIVAIEDAGFEIRDTLMWLYGSGFPKSHDISKSIDKNLGVEQEKEEWEHPQRKNRSANYTTGFSDSEERKNEGGSKIMRGKATSYKAQQWEGWGTALKPAYEPIVLARKPFKGSVANNVLKYGVGGINIDECRVGFIGKKDKEEVMNGNDEPFNFKGNTYNYKDYNKLHKRGGGNNEGRFPANVMHDGSEEATSGFPESNGSSQPRTNKTDNNVYGDYNKITTNNEIWGDSGSSARYFYCAKTSKKDRDEGLDIYSKRQTGELQGGRKENSAGSKMPSDGRINPYVGTGAVKHNPHPTVKPTDLMQYLVRLITPKGGTVLDPFMGSGSTGKATMIENNERNADYKFIGIDLTEEYIDIAKARIEYGLNYQENKAKEEESKTIDKNQTSLFDFDILEVN